MLAVITLDRVTKRYSADSVAVAELSFTVTDGELCVLVGPSGCGKTTTLRMINRLIEPSGGRILIDGTDVLKIDPVQLRRSIGYVIQQGGLFPHRRVADNVATVPRLLGWDRARVDARVNELLDLVGLDPDQYGRRFPHELSGGERQRVGVARALGGDPPGAAHGRALRRGRPHHPATTAAAVPRPAGGAEEDHRVRHARH